MAGCAGNKRADPGRKRRGFTPGDAAPVDGPALYRAYHPDAWRPAAAPEEALASEDACLALVDAFFPAAGEHMPAGRGDDCVELDMPPQVALSTDFFLQDSHFRTRYFTPGEAAAKALAVSASDLAAAGAEPMGFSLGLMLPAATRAATLSAMCEAMARDAGAWSLDLTGGDITRAACFGFSITVWGRSVAADAPFFLRRGRAEPGDVLFLVGDAGLARCGLLALEHHGREAALHFPEACLAHLRPRPLLGAGRELALFAREQGLESRLSLMDVSDGLARDVPRLLGALGAALDFSPAVAPAPVDVFARANGLDPMELFWQGGEDYALAGTCPARAWSALSARVPEARALGIVTREPGVTRNGTSWGIEGFDHFSRAVRPGATV